MGTFIELNGLYSEVVGKFNNAIMLKPMDDIDKRREKIEVDTEIISERLYDEEWTVDELLNIINELKAKGATHFKLREEWGGENPEFYFDAIAKREETDQEFTERMEKLDWLEKQEREKREANERAEFERLKKKYS